MIKENNKHKNYKAKNVNNSSAKGVEEQDLGQQDPKEMDINDLVEEQTNTPNEANLFAEIKALKEDKLRLLADLENTRKRFAREKDEAIKFAVHKFVTDLLEVYDNMTRALQAFDKVELSDEMNGLVEGVKLIMRSLDKLFSKYNIVKIDSLGCEFDQNVHQALFVADSTQYPDAKDGEVIAVVNDGFLLNGRLLRSASVGVVRK